MFSTHVQSTTLALVSVLLAATKNSKAVESVTIFDKCGKKCMWNPLWCMHGQEIALTGLGGKKENLCSSSSLTL